jgi:hypothetical protein
LIVSVWPHSSDFNYDSNIKLLRENILGHSIFVWREFEGLQRKAIVFLKRPDMQNLGVLNQNEHRLMSKFKGSILAILECVIVNTFQTAHLSFLNVPLKCRT